MPHPPRLSNLLLISIVCLARAVPAISAMDEASLEDQRAAFVAAYPAAELGDWSPAETSRELLAAYVLWPDLRAMYLRARLGSRRFDAEDQAAILEFLDQYGSLRPARDVRYQYALKLASSGRLAEYLKIYQQYYQGLEIAKLDCLALQAEIQTDRGNRIINRAHDLWLVGNSQEPECDPVFDYLKAQDQLGKELYLARFELAIAARQFALARYLSTALGEPYRDQATQWIAARDNPAAFVAARATRGDSPIHRRQLLFALEQIAYKQPETASAEWRKLKSVYTFSTDQVVAIAQHIALWSARRQAPLAYTGLIELPPAAVSTEVRRWIVRTCLRRQDWTCVIESIARMPAGEQSEEEWQYWHARALRGIAQNDHAQLILHQLAGERSYYGFLAADDLGVDYAFTHAATNSDDNILASLEMNDAVIRARELFMVGLESKGRSEWDAIIGTLGADEKIQAALLARRWGWYSRAIATAASAGHYDDLDLRYPLAYAESFEQYSTEAGISSSWAYGVARSESLFMSDVRSSAGAVGVMQLMPDTGRQTARDIQLAYAGVTTLIDPGSNIRLGTTYLGMMLERFDRNPILATAAYNAGPLNVESWLPTTDSIDARVWIENIPFNETRKYVRRVLATDAIFHWRMTGETLRMSSKLPIITATQPAGRVASNR